MKVEVLWTVRALVDLEQIVEYYTQVAGLRIASKLIVGIIMKADVLRRNPRIRQREELIAGLLTGYR